MSLWNIRKRIKKGDYVYALVPEHPKATKNGYVLEHRVVMENKIGRMLETKEEVHHIDGNRKNNSESNLEIMLNGEHQRFHSTKYPSGHFIFLVCDECGKKFKRKYHQRPENKKQKNIYCSYSCNGKAYANKYWKK